MASPQIESTKPRRPSSGIGLGTSCWREGATREWMATAGGRIGAGGVHPRERGCCGFVPTAPLGTVGTRPSTTGHRRDRRGRAQGTPRGKGKREKIASCIAVLARLAARSPRYPGTVSIQFGPGHARSRRLHAQRNSEQSSSRMPGRQPHWKRRRQISSGAAPALRWPGSPSTPRRSQHEPWPTRSQDGPDTECRRRQDAGNGNGRVDGENTTCRGG